MQVSRYNFAGRKGSQKQWLWLMICFPFSYNQTHQNNILPVSQENSFYYLFLPQTIPLWNSLPPHLIDQSSKDCIWNFLDNNYLTIYCIIVIPLCIAITPDIHIVMVNNKVSWGRHAYTKAQEQYHMITSNFNSRWWSLQLFSNIQEKWFHT